MTSSCRTPHYDTHIPLCRYGYQYLCHDALNTQLKYQLFVREGGGTGGELHFPGGYRVSSQRARACVRHRKPWLQRKAYNAHSDCLTSRGWWDVGDVVPRMSVQSLFQPLLVKEMADKAHGTTQHEHPVQAPVLHSKGWTALTHRSEHTGLHWRTLMASSTSSGVNAPHERTISTNDVAIAPSTLRIRLDFFAVVSFSTWHTLTTMTNRVTRWTQAHHPSTSIAKSRTGVEEK